MFDLIFAAIGHKRPPRPDPAALAALHDLVGPSVASSCLARTHWLTELGSGCTGCADSREQPFKQVAESTYIHSMYIGTVTATRRSHPLIT